MNPRGTGVAMRYKPSLALAQRCESESENESEA